MPTQRISNESTVSPSIVGVSMAHFDARTIINLIVDGVRSVDTKEPIQMSDKFCIGSISKSFLCEAISIYDKSIWERSVFDLLRQTLDVSPYGVNKKWKDFRVYQLANHTAGFGSQKKYHLKDWVMKPEIAKLTKEFQTKFGNNPITRKINFVQWLFSQPPEEQGTFIYSNMGFSVLAMIVELLTGEPYNNLIKKNIFDRLRIDGIWDPPKNGMQGHFFEDDGWFVWDWNGQNSLIRDSFPLELQPAGSIMINSSDLAKYGQFILNQTEDLPRKYLADDAWSTGKYGLGWQFVGNKKLHFGEWGGFLANITLIQSKKAGILVLMNSDDDDAPSGWNQEDFMTEIGDSLEKHEKFSLQETYFEKKRKFFGSSRFENVNIEVVLEENREARRAHRKLPHGSNYSKRRAKGHERAHRKKKKTKTVDFRKKRKYPPGYIPNLYRNETTISVNGDQKKTLNITAKTPKQQEMKRIIEKYMIYDLPILCSDVKIETGITPHSHPFILLDTDGYCCEQEIAVVGVFLHEQLHWFESLVTSEEYFDDVKSTFLSYEQFGAEFKKFDRDLLKNVAEHIIVCFNEMAIIRQIFPKEFEKFYTQENHPFRTFHLWIHWNWDLIEEFLMSWSMIYPWEMPYEEAIEGFGTYINPHQRTIINEYTKQDLGQIEMIWDWLQNNHQSTNFT